MSTGNHGGIVLGLGGTVDYEIALDRKVIESLISNWSISDLEIKGDVTILNERDLLLTLLHFVKSGTGGERFVTNSKDLISFASRFKTIISLGGTCVRAGIAMSYFGVESTVHLVSTSEEVRERIPSLVSTICSADHDTLDPHLIVQFNENFEIKSGDISIKALQPSRIIYTNDPPNRDLVISEELGDALKGSSVFMISGFNCIQDRAVLDQRIADLKRHMKNMPEGATLFFEDAGYHVPALSQVVRDEFLASIYVYSMNEDEMQGYIGRKVDLLEVEDVFISLTELRELIPAKNLVVHTRYWSIVIGVDSSKLVWPLQSGINMASTRFAKGDLFTPDEYYEVTQYSKSALGVDFAERMERKLGSEGRCLPGFELRVNNPTTIGLGDVFVGGFVGALAGALNQQV
jgi:ADP-dependent phosphofructokinase/glucokinase